MLFLHVSGEAFSAGYARPDLRILRILRNKFRH